jgi:hypothetical protein
MWRASRRKQWPQIGVCRVFHRLRETQSKPGNRVTKRGPKNFQLIREGAREVVAIRLGTIPKCAELRSDVTPESFTSRSTRRRA